MRTRDLVIILGSTVSDEGVLSKIAIERLEAAFDLVGGMSDVNILLTGGFGEHFNKTSRAYALYAYDYLIEKGVAASTISALIPSLDTVEDATLSARVVSYLSPNRIFVVTSDFHVERVMYIFGIVFHKKNLHFVAAAHLADAQSLRDLELKEEYELSLLKATGRSSLGSPLFEYEK
jgi:uncharacterized SAM-binding protein YcdF (DUF218 family)